MRTHARLPRSLLAASASSLALATGCFAPPALIPAADADLSKVLRSYPPDTETVELAVEPDVALRGVFVPSDPDAPVVLHLLESSGSCASQRFHLGMVTRQLSDLGFASLVVDYAGIGASSGSSSVDNLERDARTIWAEARRRAGDDKRLYIRAASLGSIPTAMLLRDGARPAGIVLIAPVLADSATTRFARAVHGTAAGLGAWLAFRDIADVDVIGELARAAVPTLVVTPADDVLLSPTERTALIRALPKVGSQVLDRAGNHFQLCVEAHTLLIEERQAFPSACSAAAIDSRVARVLAGLSADERARLDANSAALGRLTRLASIQRSAEPRMIAAAACAVTSAEIATRLLWLLAERAYPSLEFDALCDVLSVEDPAGELPIDLIEEASRLSDLGTRFGGMFMRFSSSQIAATSRDSRWDSHSVATATWTDVAPGQSVRVALDGRSIWRSLRERGLAPADANRQYMRILLRAERIPERLLRGADGTVQVEVRENGAWRVLDPVAEEKRAAREGITIQFPTAR